MESSVSSINKTIIMDPISAENNQYIHIVSSLLAQRHDVISISTALAKPFSLKRRNTVAILNWFESKVSHSRAPVLGFIKCVAILLYLKLICSTIVWVKHNHKPHDSQDALAKRLTAWITYLLSHLSTNTITHDRVEDVNSIVVPHPLYLREPYIEHNHRRDIDFLIFGQVKKYKNLTSLFEIWPQSIALTLVGKAESQELRDELNSVIQRRNLNIIWDDRFIPDEELNALLQRTRYAILPHSEDSMIVSGAFYHAITYGCNLLMSDNAFARNMADKHPFCHLLLRGEPLEPQLNHALQASVCANQLIEQAYECYSDQQVFLGFEQAISGSNGRSL
ncbi:hypothetical protein ST37_13315 [Vibrio sp. qd031]|uniref:hypothetical protein n=1 Tax=Vibrio sp. qd031 TaxID=1603038 RepID=UPI000A1207BB|nr:hypothetical protein [Vibrio sp. qd031]ORT49385.1 hypothetical protein ST37_13315 [Vibrio sp. qd031]